MNKLAPSVIDQTEPVCPKTVPYMPYVVDLPKLYPVILRLTPNYVSQACVLNYVAPEEFLANPREIPAVFADAGFRQKVYDCAEIPRDLAKTLPAVMLELKITQDTPACRNVIQEMFRTDPERAATLCLTPNGIDVFRFKDENMEPVQVI